MKLALIHMAMPSSRNHPEVKAVRIIVITDKGFSLSLIVCKNLINTSARERCDVASVVWCIFYSTTRLSCCPELSKTIDEVYSEPE